MLCISYQVGAMAGKKDKSSARELTGPQRRFADLILTGECSSLVGAYRLSYDVTGDTPKAKKSQANEASRLWKHPGIVSYADEYKAKAQAQRVRREVGERERVRQRLWNEADSADRASDRLTALRLLGQEAGMFTERVEVKEATNELTDAEVLAEIEIALRNAIEVNVSSSTTTLESDSNDKPNDDKPDGYLM